MLRFDENHFSKTLLICLWRQLIRKDAFSPVRMRAHCEDKGDSKRGTANGGAGWRWKERDSNRRIKIASKGVASGGERAQAKGTQGIKVPRMASSHPHPFGFLKQREFVRPFAFHPTHPLLDSVAQIEGVSLPFASRTQLPARCRWQGVAQTLLDECQAFSRIIWSENP